jgi:hypothetical protein
MKPLSQQTLIEAQIGFTIGILIGALGSWVYLMFFTNFEWYFKVLTCIGEIGIVGSLLLALKEIIKGRRIYLDTLKEMENIKAESEKVINEQTISNDDQLDKSSRSDDNFGVSSQQTTQQVETELIDGGRVEQSAQSPRQQTGDDDKDKNRPVPLQSSAELGLSVGINVQEQLNENKEVKQND